MNKMTLLAACLLLALGVGLGCECDKEKRDNDLPKASAPDLKTLDEYREEAAKQINKDNAEDELKKLKAEIESDL